MDQVWLGQVNHLRVLTTGGHVVEAEPEAAVDT